MERSLRPELHSVRGRIDGFDDDAKSNNNNQLQLHHSRVKTVERNARSLEHTSTSTVGLYRLTIKPDLLTRLKDLSSLDRGFEPRS